MSAWWAHDSFTMVQDGLTFDGVDLRELAQQHGTPLFVYSRAPIRPIHVRSAK
jgi:diaminopimelate decarboxylase